MRLAAILLVIGFLVQDTPGATPAAASSVRAGTSQAADSTPEARSYLALGDSYTIGQSVDSSDRYPVQLVKMLNTDGQKYAGPEIIATSGWTTANLLNALRDKKADTPYDLVTLLIGVNNQYQRKSQARYREEFTLLLQQAIGLAGDNASHVLVLSIPDYSVTPFANGYNTSLIAAQIDSFNAINYKLSLDYQVHYLDITAESRKAAADGSLIASDGLHFSGKEYAIWAKMLEPVMKRISK